MALTNCPNCQKQISNTVSRCIHCGCSVAYDSFGRPLVYNEAMATPKENLPSLVEKIDELRKTDTTIKTLRIFKTIFAYATVLFTLLLFGTGAAYFSSLDLIKNLTILQYTLLPLFFSVMGALFACTNQLLTWIEYRLTAKQMANLAFSAEETLEALEPLRKSAKAGDFYLPVAFVLGGPAKNRALAYIVLQSIYSVIAEVALLVLFLSFITQSSFTPSHYTTIGLLVAMMMISISITVSGKLLRSSFDHTTKMLTERQAQEGTN